MSPRWLAAIVLILTGCGIAYAQSVDTRHLHTPSQIRIVGPSLVGREDATKGGAETITLGENLTLVDGVLSATGDGTPGDPGPGVAAGGTEGQVLTKQSSDDYDTDWETPDTDFVRTFNGRPGPSIDPQSGDYTVGEITGAVPDTRTISVGVGLTGGGDLSANRTIGLDNTDVTPGTYTNSTVTIDEQGRITSAATGTVTTDLDVRQSGSLVGTRPAINLIAGSNVTLNVTDDAANNRVNISISATGGAGSGVWTEIPCTGNITSALTTALNASEPVLIGPGSCTVTSPLAPTVTRIQWRGSGIRATEITFTTPAAGRCGFERLPATGDGLSQSTISDMRFVMTGTTRDIFCINGLSNGTLVENIDLRTGKRGFYVQGAASDDSACYRCTFTNLFFFQQFGAQLDFEGAGSDSMLAELRMLDLHSDFLPMIEVTGMRGEDSHMLIEGLLLDSDQNNSSGNFMVFSGNEELPVVIMSGGLFGTGASGSTSFNFIQSNSNIALTSFGFNTRGNPAAPWINCQNFIDYISPASHADIACSTSPGMATGLGKPAVVNGRSLTVP